MIHDEDLIIPYAMSDHASSYATVNLRELLDVLKATGTDKATPKSSFFEQDIVIFVSTIFKQSVFMGLSYNIHQIQYGWTYFQPKKSPSTENDMNAFHLVKCE